MMGGGWEVEMSDGAMTEEEKEDIEEEEELDPEEFARICKFHRVLNKA